VIISFLSQKGGVSKSALARTTAVGFINGGWRVHVADLDEKQQTTMKWCKRREDNGLNSVDCAVYRRAASALKVSHQHDLDLVIIDGRPAAEHSYLEISKGSDLVVLTTGATVDDLEPSLELGRELVKGGLDKNHLVFSINKAPSEAEAIKAIATITEWGFKSLKSIIYFQNAYGQALDKGRALTETPYSSLNEKAQEMVDEIDKLINSSKHDIINS